MPDNVTVLAFDFGMKRIGVAVGQTAIGVANPLDVIKARDGIPNWDTLKQLIETWQPQQLIVGHPINMDGSDQQVTHAARRFAGRLGHRYNLPVTQVDERMTTVAARDWAFQDRNRQQSIDSIAAKLILEDWFAQLKP